jgi:hypothetical protein
MSGEPVASTKILGPTEHDAALIRHAGWVFSLLLAAAAAIVVKARKKAPTLKAQEKWASTVLEDLLLSSPILFSFCLTALEAISSDLVRSDAHTYHSQDQSACPGGDILGGRGPSTLSSAEPWEAIFNCGNFGVLLLSTAAAAKVRPLLRRMIQVTQARGAQSAGIVTYKVERAKALGKRPSAYGTRKRVVNGKRTDLSDLVLREAASVLDPGAISAPQLFQGHTRFATSSVADLSGCHPHQWSRPSQQEHWYVMGGAYQSTTRNVEAYITHNGDLDFLELHGVVYSLDKIQLLLVSLLHAPMPASVDSMCVAGLLELLRTQGLWKASVRFGYLFGGLASAGNLADLAGRGGMWNAEAMQAVTSFFEAEWRSLVAEDRQARSRMLDIDAVQVEDAADLEASAPPPAALPEMMRRMAERVGSLLPERLEQMGASMPVSDAASACRKLAEEAVDAFQQMSLLSAARLLLSKARGSFGLVLSHSLDAHNEVRECAGSSPCPSPVARRPLPPLAPC